MLIVVMLVLGLPLALAMAPLFIVSKRYRRERRRRDLQDLKLLLVAGSWAGLQFDHHDERARDVFRDWTELDVVKELGPWPTFHIRGRR